MAGERISSHALTFEGTPAPAASQRLEMKLCEFCPRNFTRAVGSGQRYCRHCASQFVLQPAKVLPLDPRREWDKRLNGHHNTPRTEH